MFEIRSIFFLSDFYLKTFRFFFLKFFLEFKNEFLQFVNKFVKIHKNLKKT